MLQAKLIRLGVVIVFLLIGTSANFAQKMDGVTPRVSNCERMVTVLDSAGILYGQTAPDDEVIIVIAGSRNTADKSYDLARIDQVKRYLNKFYGVKHEKIEFGIARSVNSLSFLRIYIKGKLIGEIFTTRKGNLCRATNGPI